MSIFVFLATVTPILFSLYWLFVFVRMIRSGNGPGQVALLVGIFLYGLSIFVIFAAREERILENAARSALGEYLLKTSFFSGLLERLAPQYLAAVVSALTLWLGLLGIMVWSRQRFYDASEAGMVAIGALMAGWPGVFVFLALLFLLVFIVGIAHVLLARRRTNDRFAIGPMIPVAAILTIWLGTAAVNLTGLFTIRF